jgi:hypothetical protein
MSATSAVVSILSSSGSGAACIAGAGSASRRADSAQIIAGISARGIVVTLIIDAASLTRSPLFS